MPIKLVQLSTATLISWYIQKEIREMYGKCSIDNDKPDVIVTTQVIFDAYEESLQAQKRFGASSSSLADAGFDNLLYRGTPIVVDDHCPDGMMFFLNTKYIKFRHHASRNFAFQGFNKPVNQDASVAHIYWLGALTCSNPRMLGRLPVFLLLTELKGLIMAIAQNSSDRGMKSVGAEKDGASFCNDEAGQNQYYNWFRRTIS